jgi:hypothetical protein
MYMAYSAIVTSKQYSEIPPPAFEAQNENGEQKLVRGVCLHIGAAEALQHEQ